MSLPTFENFFTEVHGHSPFPWQRRLANLVVERGRWPEVLDLPTGSGKTSAIDIGLYTLAARPDVFPRRIVLVVDRRVVVDQAADHARMLREAMKLATNGAAAEIADRLRGVFGGVDADEPFDIAMLRGGMPRDESWARHPDRPIVALSTVDQAGSRLLFRGYGVSPRMAPIHAGLLGNDTLLLLDEVQLSTAFAETLRGLDKRWMRWNTNHAALSALPSRWASVRMSATPVGEFVNKSGRFTLDEADHADPGLSKRLGARKLALLKPVRVSGKGDELLDDYASAFVETAHEHLKQHAMTIAVIVNRVDLARRIFKQLYRRKDAVEVVLITGRMRPLDRARLLGDPKVETSLLARLTSGRNRASQERPLIVVSTQSIEAGADFDFDALVTESASFDALRQRFGRLDRRGDLGATKATILLRHDHFAESYEDPIYGRALNATWHWMQSIAAADGQIDFGIDQFPVPEPDQLTQLCSEIVHSPVLLPAHLDTWAQTNPRPEPDPDVSLWLHGAGRGMPEVQIVWRADIHEEELAHTLAAGDEPLLKELQTRLEAQLEACPPSSLEAISVPLYAARAWLNGAPSEPFSDVEGAANSEQELERKAETHSARPCVRYRRGEVRILGEASEISPTDTIVVPATYGGQTAHNWDPQGNTGVGDLGDWAQLVHRGRPVVRLVPEVLLDWAQPTSPARDQSVIHEPTLRVPVSADAESSGLDLREIVEEWLPSLQKSADPQLKTVLSALASGYRVVILPDGHLTLVGRRNVAIAKALSGGFTVDDVVSDVISEDDDSSSFTGRELKLSVHLADVRDKAKSFAVNLGFSTEIAEDIALAAWLHDIGKADPRFQRMLMGGSEVHLNVKSDLLAKSSGEMRDLRAREKARVRANYPRGYRHEILSVAMLDGIEFGANDRDLVLHLVGSHHGWCRPFAPAIDSGPSIPVELTLDGYTFRADTAHEFARIDSGIAERFHRLVGRYGWWGLAWMESVLRLADHRASEMAESAGSTREISSLASDGSVSRRIETS